jgi:hypothetical protein
MKKETKPRKNKNLGDYVYIRLSKDMKKELKKRAELEGSNMTIWVRQLVMRALEE